MADLEGRVFAFEWRLPHDSPVGMMAYAMVQELATGLSHHIGMRGTAEVLPFDRAMAKTIFRKYF